MHIIFAIFVNAALLCVEAVGFLKDWLIRVKMQIPYKKLHQHFLQNRQHTLLRETKPIIN